MTDTDREDLETEEVTAYRAEGRKARRPARAPLSEEERAAMRRAGAEDARLSRLRQGLPERIEDPAAIAALAELLCTERTSPQADKRQL